MQPAADVLGESIDAVSSNAKKLLEDAELLLGWDRFSTALALAVLAQEEFAKSFLLRLVKDGAIPWLPEVRQILRRHESKHLAALLLEWLPPWETAIAQSEDRMQFHKSWIAWHERRMQRRTTGQPDAPPEDLEPVRPQVSFPREVAIAINILRHEQVERARGGASWKDPDYSKGLARKIADGLLDRKKQSALYVNIDKMGRVNCHPDQISPQEAQAAIEKAKTFGDLFHLSDEYEALTSILPKLFESLVS